MIEFLLALESEEIPAGMQRAAAELLAQTVSQQAAALNPCDIMPFWGATRIGLRMFVDATIPATTQSERGPRVTAPEAALAGFLRKHQATKEALVQAGDFWLLERRVEAVAASDRLRALIPEILWNFAWPKSMRWGRDSQFNWVRPLRRIIATLDGAPLAFTLARGDDAAHGLKSSNLAKGHRFLSPTAFPVTTFESYREGLAKHHVLLDATTRRDTIRDGLDACVRAHNLAWVEDDALLEEISGLTEWPTPMLGQIDPRYMTLPVEVMQVSMRVNQRYFATRDTDGQPAPYFVFVANQTFADSGAQTAAGNARVLRARFADAWHFWTLDRRAALSTRTAALEQITFHKRLGSLGARVNRVIHLAGVIAQALGLSPEDIAKARRAALLAKADLTTGMVAEFPELQGVMGGYYATHDGEDPAVAQAIAAHYQPRSLTDATPRAPVSIAVALADRLDVLAGFFTVDEIPSGSGDPYALRRAALGVIRIIRDNGLRLDLQRLISEAVSQQPVDAERDAVTSKLLDFISERMRVQLRQEGERYDVLTALMSPERIRDITDLLRRTEALTRMITTDDGANLLAASKRAANILRIENKKDGPLGWEPNPAYYQDGAERTLAEALDLAGLEIQTTLRNEEYTLAMQKAAALRAPLDQFFDHVTINDPDPTIRQNRLRLLGRLTNILTKIADFSKLDG